MYVRKAKAETEFRPFVVEDELQWDPGHSARLVSSALQRVPDPNADDIEVTESKLCETQERSLDFISVAHEC